MTTTNIEHTNGMRLCVSCLLGLEGPIAGELRRVGFAQVSAENGRVYFSGGPEEIIKADLYFIDRIGLREHLSPTRSNGIAAMLKQMKLFALAFFSKG